MSADFLPALVRIWLALTACQVTEDWSSATEILIEIATIFLTWPLTVPVSVSHNALTITDQTDLFL